jgi:eukaryotic-like serine/threonine-protein kinase
MVLGRLPLRPRQVEADIRKLEGEGSTYALRVGALLRADLAAVRGEPGAAERYAQAAAGLEQAGLHVHAAAARLRQGELLGGSEGAVRAEAARGWMRERGVVQPEAWGRLFSSAPEHLKA